MFPLFLQNSFDLQENIHRLLKYFLDCEKFLGFPQSLFLLKKHSESRIQWNWALKFVEVSKQRYKAHSKCERDTHLQRLLSQAKMAFL